MRIYLAARYSRNDEMRGVRDVLQGMGHKVTSRWIDLHPDIVGDFSESFTVDTLNSTPELCAPLGQHDLDDIDLADCVISFAEPNGGGKGGRHVEFGYALGRGKRMILVGPRENVFHTHYRVDWYPNWPMLVRALAKEYPNEIWTK